MRNLVCSVAALAALALVACGPSSKEVAMAKTARYKADKLQLFGETKAVVESKYEVVKSDETTLQVQTKPKWYTWEGMVVTRFGSPERGEGLVPDRSIHFAMIIELLPDGDAWVVKITPWLQFYQIGSPQPQPLKETDANVPGWVHSKVDSMAMDINKALKQWEAGSVPSTIPPGQSPLPAEQPPVSEAPAEPAPQP
jgi:hypothetical protein